MKFVFLFFSFIIASITNAQIKLLTDFENANVDTAVTVYNYRNNTIAFTPYLDKSNTENVWFYFGVTGFRRDTILTFLMDYNNNYYPPNYPVVSFNGTDFFNVKAVQRGNINRFSVLPESDTVYVSTGYPYSYSRLQKYISTLLGNALISADSSKYTEGGRRIYYLTATDPSVSNRHKKTVWIIARQHAFESLSNYVVEGMISYLISGQESANNLLGNYIFNIVPMVDIDNVVAGQSGRMGFPRDFNRDWDSPIHSEIITLQKWIKKSSKQRYDMFFDIHCTYPGGSAINVFSYFDIYGYGGKADNLNLYWQRFYKNANYRPKKITDTSIYPEGMSADCFNARKYRKLQFSTTIECDWNINSRGKVWQISDFYHLGENIVKAIPAK
ncbi:MAG: hypothetical protein J6Z01_08275 [Bacteroidales bacterium]|nr:hypothetical protein [Bacteroidales bacterium]